MTIPVTLKDPNNSNSALIGDFGQVVVGARDFSTPVSVKMLTAGIYNLIEPRASSAIIITSYSVSTTRASHINGNEISIYESDAIDSSTSVKGVYDVDLAKQAIISRSVNIIVPKGLWVNASSSEDGADVTIEYYYVVSG